MINSLILLYILESAASYSKLVMQLWMLLHYKAFHFRSEEKRRYTTASGWNLFDIYVYAFSSALIWVFYIIVWKVDVPFTFI